MADTSPAVRAVSGFAPARRVEPLASARPRAAAVRGGLVAQLLDQQRALVTTQQSYERVLEAFTEFSIVVTDLSGKIRTWNDGARNQYGYEAAEVVRRDLEILEANTSVEHGCTKDILELALRNGGFTGELERTRKNGEAFAALVAVVPRRDRNGNAVGFQVITKDLTRPAPDEHPLLARIAELEEQNRRLQQTNRSKGRVLASMSHELRTPLTGILGLAALMQDGGTGPVSSVQEECLTDILSSGQHLLRLLEDVLDLAKIEAGRIGFRIDEVDLAGPVGEVCDVLGPLAAQKRIRIDTSVDPRIGSVFTDATRLKQVLYNYLSNALKFTLDGGSVQVRILAEDDDFFRIEVEDSGIGIERENLKLLFLEFERLDADSSVRVPGTGLGLALTRSVVEAQGGSVHACSEPNVGSVFVARLPRVLVGSGDLCPPSARRERRLDPR